MNEPHRQDPAGARGASDGRSLGFDGEAAFRARVIAQLTGPSLAPVRRMDWVDADFERWPLGEPSVLEALSAWARQPGRQLRLLARRYTGLARVHPRFVDWRRTHAHVIEARSPEDEALELPCQLLLDRRRAIVVHDRARWRGAWVDDAPAVFGLGRALEPLWERSTAAFPASVLGL